MERTTRSTAKSRNVTVRGHRTSLRLQQDLWDAIEEICARERLTIHEFCTRIADNKHVGSLTSHVRVYTLCYFREAATDEGHTRAGHGAYPQRGKS